jgi:putative DNA primase/helicase
MARSAGSRAHPLAAPTRNTSRVGRWINETVGFAALTSATKTGCASPLKKRRGNFGSARLLLHRRRIPGRGGKVERRQTLEAESGGASTGAQAPAFSDEALVLLFAERHAGDLRYVAAWARWLSWTGTHWRFDDTLRAFDLARQVIRDAASQCNKAKMIASAKTVAAVERLARSDRRLAATVDQWDADPWLLNTPDGVVDLRTGETRAHQLDDYATKITTVGPGGECSRFLSFLDRTFAHDRELIAYVQRALGYCLTGITREHALFFGYGTGANGKGALLGTVASLLGDYPKGAPIETFTASTGDRHPTDLAGLRGARLVSASETEEGRRWAEARVKQLTGGDVISARLMRQDFFDFLPAFKLFITGNHKPSLRSVDEAIRRRFHLIPFAVTIPEEERDPDLKTKLESEWPGILAWMIKGCLGWQAGGLRPPKAVTDATAAYLEAEDAIAAWLTEKCERDPKAWSSSSSLFASWSAWATAAGEFVGAQKKLSQALVDRGFTTHNTSKARGLIGLRVIPEETHQPYWETRE